MHAIWAYVTDFGDTAVTIPLAGLMAGFLLVAKQYRLAFWWLAAIVTCAGLIASMKIALAACGHPLPGAGLASPSGHTAMSLAVYGGFAAILGAEAGPSARALLIGGTAGLVGGIALSRAMLHVHTVPEVIVGLAVGLLVLAAIAAIVTQRPLRHPRIGWVAASALGIALLAHGQRWPAEHAIHRVAGWLGMLQPWCG